MKQACGHFMILLSILSGPLFASESIKHWDSKYRYGIEYPDDWKNPKSAILIGSSSFTLVNPSGDIELDIVAQEINTTNGEKSITDIKGAAEYFTANIMDQFNTASTKSGVTFLADQPALWLRYSANRTTMNTTVFLTAYQISIMRNNIMYSITARSVNNSLMEANAVLNNNWPAIDRIIQSFTTIRPKTK